MKRARLILNIITILLVLFQILGYIGRNITHRHTTGTNLVAYYIGFNMPVILAAILFTMSWYLKRKIQKKESQTLIDSIGKE
ncbi:hypothetical protein CAP36_14530 [Chitinophagaceae bacterium IBVUCB2]|nr:hypothetical protein CAP36_14530 [Chitinophagaceae bacterium IBVUCB2]